MAQPDNAQFRAAINFFCAAFIVVVTLILVSQLGSQTRWLERADLVMQPGFFPALGLLVMGVPALVLTVVSFRQMRSGVELESPRIILAGFHRCCEFALWFLFYVYIIRWTGYLLATLVFMPALSLRVGFRGTRWMLTAVLIGLVIVLLFRTGLQVRLPEGHIYELLPDEMRNFMIRNF